MDLTIWCLITLFGVLPLLPEGRAFSLPSPENVTVNCDNFETIVYWNYSENVEDPLFRVELTGDIPNSANVKFKTRDRYANITGRLGNTNYNVYTIKIRATNLTHESSFSQPVRFVFDERLEKDDIIICKLDFPPVDMEYAYGQITLSFQNPLHLYENTPALQALKQNTSPNLKTSNLCYQVIDQSNIISEYECPYERTTCMESLHISDKKERYCINLSGRIAERANVREAQYCVSQKGSPPPSGIVAMVSVMLILVASFALAALVFRKKIVRPNQTFPFSWPDPSKQKEDKGARSIYTTHIPPPSEIDLLSVEPDYTESETCESLYNLNAKKWAPSIDRSRFRMGSDQVCTREEQSRVNEALETATESTDWQSDRTSQDERIWENSGGTHLSDYDAPQVMPVGVRLGDRADGEEEGGEEEDVQSVGSPELGNSSGLATQSWSNADLERPVNKEFPKRLEGAESSDYDSTHCIVIETARQNKSDGLDGEEEYYKREQQIEQEPRSDYEPRNNSVEVSLGDGYASGEILD